MTKSKEKNYDIHIWPSPPARRFLDTSALMRELAVRWERYDVVRLDERISEFEDMLDPSEQDIDSYKSVGRSALQNITEAMLLSGRMRFDDILDLPCGGGRVTRHLQAFFPDSDLYVADIDQDKQRAVEKQFSAKAFDFHVDYDGAPSRCFDLIFSGSLLTHFDKDMFERALSYFIDALKPDGIAVLTLHGRGSASHSLEPSAFSRLMDNKNAFLEHFKKIKNRPKFNIDPETAIKKDFLEKGFGYFAMPTWTEMYKQSYGGSYSSASWMMKNIEARTDCLILGYKEMSYGNSQDVIVLQKI